MQWRGLFAGNHRAWLIHLRLAQQRSGVGYARLLQFIFKNGTGITCAILNGKGQREWIGPLGQAAGERIAVEIARYHVQLAILCLRGAFRQRPHLAEHRDRVVRRHADKR